MSLLRWLFAFSVTPCLSGKSIPLLFAPLPPVQSSALSFTPNQDKQDDQEKEEIEDKVEVQEVQAKEDGLASQLSAARAITHQNEKLIFEN